MNYYAALQSLIEEDTVVEEEKEFANVESGEAFPAPMNCMS